MIGGGVRTADVAASFQSRPFPCTAYRYRRSSRLVNRGMAEHLDRVAPYECDFSGNVYCFHRKNGYICTCKAETLLIKGLVP